MELVDLGIVVFAAMMVWLLYKVTKETKAFTATQKRYVLREAHESGPRAEARDARSELAVC